jgi:hypothetical protein
MTEKERSSRKEKKSSCHCPVYPGNPGSKKGLKSEEKNGSPGPGFAEATPWQASPRMTEKERRSRKE